MKKKKKNIKTARLCTQYSLRTPTTTSHTSKQQTANMPPNPAPKKIQLPAFSFVKALLAIRAKHPEGQLSW
jgi:hypothetical protein